MFNAPLPSLKIPLNLSLLDSAEKQLSYVHEHFKISEIFCEIDNPKDYNSPKPHQTLIVSKIVVPPGTSSYIKSRLKECENSLVARFNEYINGDDNYEDITAALDRSIENCRKWFMDELTVFGIVAPYHDVKGILLRHDNDNSKSTPPILIKKLKELTARNIITCEQKNHW